MASDIGPYLPDSGQGAEITGRTLGAKDVRGATLATANEGTILGGSDPLEQLKTWFREAEDALFTARKGSERDRDYVDGKQWTTDEESALRKRGQAAIVFNRMRQKVDTLIGVEQEMRSDPKAYPRTPDDEESAQVATDAIRYVCDNNDFDSLASLVFDQACCVEGAAGVEVSVELKPGRREPEIVLRVYPFDRLGWDPHSRRDDYADSRYEYTVIWMDGAQAQKLWPHAAEHISATIAAAPMTSRDTYEDTPRYWADRTRNRVQVVQMHWREGGDEWLATFIQGGFLEAPQPSLYVDEYGATDRSLILCSGYITREGERYGAARQWVGPQDDINKRRSKALHLLSVRQTYSDQGVIQDIRTMKRELSRPDGHVAKDGEGEFGILPTGDMASGQFELLASAKEEIDSTGPTPHSVMQAQAGAAESGIARQSNQRAQMLPLSPLLDHHRSWKLRVYRAIWNRIRQFWTAPKWVRVTDNPDAMRWVGLNQPVTLGQQIQSEGMTIPPQMAGDPRLQMVVGMQNQPALMDVDVIIDEGPDVVTTAAQEFELLTRLYQSAPGQIPLVALIKASPLRSKDALVEAIEGSDEQKAVIAAQQQEQAAVEQRGVMAQIARSEADAAQKAADADYKRAQTAQIAAETPSEIEYTEAQADKTKAEALKAAREASLASQASEVSVTI